MIQEKKGCLPEGYRHRRIGNYPFSPTQIMGLKSGNSGRVNFFLFPNQNMDTSVYRGWETIMFNIPGPIPVQDGRILQKPVTGQAGGRTNEKTRHVPVLFVCVADYFIENSIKLCKMELCTPELYNFLRKKAFSCSDQGQQARQHGCGNCSRKQCT